MALLPLLAPATTALPGGLERASGCAAREDQTLAVSRDWMGSLKGWPDSALVQAWRGSLALAKGRSGRPDCGAAYQPEP